jgi:hypothetical protein
VGIKWGKLKVRKNEKNGKKWKKMEKKADFLLKPAVSREFVEGIGHGR